jgi:curved DNA-binding protein CbpA
MTKLKNYLFIALLTFAVVPMHGMQKGLGYLRKKINLENHYDLLEVNSSATHDEIKQAYKKMALKYHPDRHPGNEEAVTEKMKTIIGANEVLTNPVKRQQYDLSCTFVDLYITGSLLVGTAATVAGLIKAWQLYKEYSSPNAILLEKIEVAANKAVNLILNLEFDRYNPTKDTDALCLQFELEPLFAQLSPEVRKQVKQSVIAFDKTLEATYEQCAWHYDGMMPEELVMKNPRLVYAMRSKLELLLEALELCKTDLQLDRNKPLEFIKAHYKKMIGLGLAGTASWYGFKKFMARQNAPQAQQPVIYRLGNNQ